MCGRFGAFLLITWDVVGGHDATSVPRSARSTNLGEVRGVGDNKLYNLNYTNAAQPIKGRITYCLMTRFERLWLDAQRGTLPSLKLDDCSKLVLGEDAGKVSKTSKKEVPDMFKDRYSTYEEYEDAMHDFLNGM